MTPTRSIDCSDGSDNYYLNVKKHKTYSVTATLYGRWETRRTEAVDNLRLA